MILYLPTVLDAFEWSFRAADCAVRYDMIQVGLLFSKISIQYLKSIIVSNYILFGFVSYHLSILRLGLVGIVVPGGSRHSLLIEPHTASQ